MTTTSPATETAYVSRSGMAHTRNCPVVTRMLAPIGPSTGRREITRQTAVDGIAKGTYKPCAACQKIEAKEAAPVKTSKAATAAVRRNLVKDYVTTLGRSGTQTGEVWEHMSGKSVEDFERDAKAYLGDRSNLRTATLNSADWPEIYAEFYPPQDEAPAEAEPVNEGVVTVGSDAELGDSLPQVVVSIAALVEDGCTALRIESGPLAGVEDALLAAAPALARLHRARVGQRVTAGLAAAREQGRRGGRPKVVDDGTRAALVARVEGGESVTSAAKALGISRASAYRALQGA